MCSEVLSVKTLRKPGYKRAGRTQAYWSKAWRMRTRARLMPQSSASALRRVVFFKHEYTVAVRHAFQNAAWAAVPSLHGTRLVPTVAFRALVWALSACRSTSWFGFDVWPQNQPPPAGGAGVHADNYYPSRGGQRRWKDDALPPLRALIGQDKAPTSVPSVHSSRAEAELVRRLVECGAATS